jgi:hypothetical protein
MGRALIFHGYIWIEFCGRLDIYAVARSQRVTKKTGDRKRWRESRRWGIARGYEGKVTVIGVTLTQVNRRNT